MRIQDILSVIPNLPLGNFDLSQEISSVFRESTKLSSNGIFVAIKGNSWDGHNFLEEALRAPIAMAIAEHYTGKDKRVVIVKNTRKVFAELCHIFQHKPSSSLFTVGITGTNGKTTTSFMVETILNKIGYACGVIGTIDHHLQNKVWPTSLTSPGAEELQLRLRQFLEAGAKACVMEVSSHALDQYRVDGTQFDVAIYTNLTQDHLDYHKTMEQYFLAKNRLFSNILTSSDKKQPIAIINEDDSYANKIHTNAKRYGYGMKHGDIRFTVSQMNFEGTDIIITENQKKFTTKLSTIGLHNVYNAIGASLVTKSFGMQLVDAIKILSQAPQVPGRLEKIENTKTRHIFIDYAHTPDALERALVFLRDIQTQQKIPSQRLIVVFGAGGNRDKGKRPLMGEIASRLADVVYITSDNPRFEKPEVIIEDIVVGCKQAKHLFTITSRKEAIQAAIKNSHENDIILIAGKGHENYQEIEGIKHPFSDQDCVREYFQ